VLRLSEALVSQGIALRHETADDVIFLEQLYRSVRWEELAVTSWPDSAKIAFLSQQFALQRHHYLTHYRETAFDVVTRHDVPVGRLYLDRGPVEYRIVDISLLPDARGTGIGTALLEAILAEAMAAGRTVTIHVEKQNPAQRLYRRLGFRPIAESGPYDCMQWQRDSAPVAGQVYTA
jgi:ribosomal protein S18 acetylase RimI-like enzyme